jgi:hypothetical protein
MPKNYYNTRKTENTKRKNIKLSRHLKVAVKTGLHYILSAVNSKQFLLDLVSKTV